MVTPGVEPEVVKEAITSTGLLAEEVIESQFSDHIVVYVRSKHITLMNVRSIQML